MQIQKTKNITVLTSITGGKDTPMEEQVTGNAKFIAYTDSQQMSNVWEVRKAPTVFVDPRRNSRLPKILSHLYSDTEYSLWIDGNMSLLKPPEELVERYLKNHDMALFKHPGRTCIYDEAIRCAKSKLDDPEIIIEQVSRYESEGYSKDKGLCECGFMLRRHTKKVVEFNNCWWSEHCRGSVRDQISFMYAANKVGLRVNVIDSAWYLDENGTDVRRDDFIRMVPHAISNPKVI